VATEEYNDYLQCMPLTLEERVEELEKKFIELMRKSASVETRNRKWQETFGLSREDDEGFSEMVRLGQEYRRSLSSQDGRADS